MNLTVKTAVHSCKTHQVTGRKSSVLQNVVMLTGEKIIVPKFTVKSVCLNCGTEFSDYSYRNRKYCSHRCYISNRYKGENGHETE